MQQDVVLFADFLHTLPVAFWRSDDTAAGCDRLKAECTDGIGAFAQDDLFDLVRGPDAVIFLGRAGLLVLAVLHAVRHADETGREGSVLGVALVLTACGHRRQGRAVVVAVTVQDLVLLAAIALVRDLANDLEALLVGLRTGIRIVDAAHAGHLLDQLLGKDRAGDRADGAAEEVHLEDLVTHGIGNALAAVAHIDCPDAA